MGGVGGLLVFLGRVLALRVLVLQVFAPPGRRWSLPLPDMSLFWLPFLFLFLLLPHIKFDLISSAEILPCKDFMNCFWVSCSTSSPGGARAIKSTSETCRSSFWIISPPRSPSKKAVADFCLHRSMTVLGTFVPWRAMQFFRPKRRQVTRRPAPQQLKCLLIHLWRDLPGVVLFHRT